MISISTKPISCLIEKRIIVYGYCINILTFVITNFAVLYIADWLIGTYYSKVGVRVTLSALMEYNKCLAVCYLIAMSDRETYPNKRQDIFMVRPYNLFYHGHEYVSFTE